MKLINKKILILPIILIISLIFSYYFGEDTLGAAKHDYFFQVTFILPFSENFLDTFQNFGIGELQARNSPVFSIIVAFLINLGLNLELFRYLNCLILLPLIYFFYKCLELKFKNIAYETKIIFVSVLLLSPTIRSLIIWPYPLIYALLFFLISTFFYLKFDYCQSKKEKIYYAILNIFVLAVSSYFSPNFALFSIFFFYQFFKFFKLSRNLILIIFLNILFALPAIYFAVIKEFYFFKMDVTAVSLGSKLNFSNKIILISTIILFYFLPFISMKKRLIIDKFKLNKNLFFLIIFIALNIFFFNYDNQTAGLGRTGGGIFFHLSQLLFSNHLLVYCIFIIFAYIVFAYELINLNNIIIFFILVTYNAQYSIYHKYFDPLIYFILLFLIDFNNKKIQINFKNLSYKYTLLYLSFLFISFFKNFLINL